MLIEKSRKPPLRILRTRSATVVNEGGYFVRHSFNEGGFFVRHSFNEGGL